jgi:hypothetical protein
MPIRGFWSYYCELMGIAPGSEDIVKQAAAQIPLQKAAA